MVGPVRHLEIETQPQLLAEEAGDAVPTRNDLDITFITPRKVLLSSTVPLSSGGEEVYSRLKCAIHMDTMPVCAHCTLSASLHSRFLL